MNESYIPNKIIILGGNHHNSLGLVRSLGEIGCKVYYISTVNSNSFVAKSKYIKNYWYAGDISNVLNILLNKFKNEINKPFIFPSDDETVELIDENISELKEKYIIPNINNEINAISKHMDKKYMTDLAKTYGLLTPKSMVIPLKSSMTLSSQIKKNKMNFPMIIKPLRSTDGNKKNIKIVNNIREFSQYINKKQNMYEKILIQEYIEKEYEIGIQGLSTLKNNEVIITSITKRIRESPIAPSATYAKVYPPNQFKYIDEIKTLLKNINYKGIFDIDLIYSKGKYYFIEINYRNGAYGYALTKSGVNIPELWCLNAINKDISTKAKQINKSITFISEFADFRNVLYKKTGIFKWIKQFITADAYLIMNLKDPMPFIYKIIER